MLRALRAELVAALAPGGTLKGPGTTPQAQPLADERIAGGGIALVHVRPSTDDPQWSCAVLRADLR